jgi:formylglycine-generating enzyme required for sulfatase activity
VPGVFDMSGNAYEWENSCGDLPADNCFIRGGSFQTTSEDILSCAGRATRARNVASPNTGMRCCAD